MRGVFGGHRGEETTPDTQYNIWTLVMAQRSKQCGAHYYMS
jgi:hypothetical protein